MVILAYISAYILTILLVVISLFLAIVVCVFFWAAFKEVWSILKDAVIRLINQKKKR